MSLRHAISYFLILRLIFEPVQAITPISPGLSYRILAFTTKGENEMQLVSQPEQLVLRCHYSLQDCSFEIQDFPVSYCIEFFFDRSYLGRFQGAVNPALFFEEQELRYETCCNTRMLLHEVLFNKHQGTFSSMFMESKAISLFLCFHSYHTQHTFSCSSCKFLSNAVEKEKILKAKKILLKRLSNPPTISDLSRELAINECYLKKGFKEVYGHTIFEFVQSQRMQEAKRLLKSSLFSVSQVADQLGYSSLSNFSSAFKKHTGAYPTDYIKSEIHSS